MNSHHFTAKLERLYQYRDNLLKDGDTYLFTNEIIKMMEKIKNFYYQNTYIPLSIPTI